MSSYTIRSLHLFNKLVQITKYYSTQVPKIKVITSEDCNMMSWQIDSYGDLSNLHLSENTPVPVIRNSNEVLIKVAATSLNPLDLEMIRK